MADAPLPGPRPGETPTELTAEDRRRLLAAEETKLLCQIRESNEWRREAVELSRGKSGAEALQGLAERLRRDAEAGDEEVGRLARERGLALPDKAPGTADERQESLAQAALLERLRHIDGEEFVRWFARGLRLDHRRSFARLQRALSTLPPESPVRGLAQSLHETQRRRREEASDVLGGRLDWKEFAR